MNLSGTLFFYRGHLLGLICFWNGRIFLRLNRETYSKPIEGYFRERV